MFHLEARAVSETQSFMMVTATKACDTGTIKKLKYCSMMFLIKMVSKLLEKTKLKKKRTKPPN